MSVYEIPLSPAPQSFGITLGGVDYKLTMTYQNTANGGWTLDIADASGVAIVNGVPLVTGCDLLGQYKHLGFNGGLYVQTSDAPDAVPAFDNLGITSHLYWVTE